MDTFGVNDLETARRPVRAARLDRAAGRHGEPPGAAGRPVYRKNAAVLGFVISHATSAELGTAAARTNQLLAAGDLRPRRTEELPPSAMAEAHRRVEAGGLRGTRLILRP